MIAVDTNIIVYSFVLEAPFHAEALQQLQRLAGGRTPWTIPWPCLHEFLAVVTSRGMLKAPSGMERASAQVDAWLASPVFRALGEGTEHWPRLRALIAARGVRGGQVHDARIAAICLEHGIDEFWSADRDFSRFPELRTRNPLIA